MKRKSESTNNDDKHTQAWQQNPRYTCVPRDFIQSMKLLVLWSCSPTSSESRCSFVSLSLSCSLARPFLVHPETGTKQCPDRFQHDKHATKTIYSVWPPLHFALIAIHVEDRHRPLPKITSNARRQQATNNDAFRGPNRARPGHVLCTPDRGRSCQWILVQFVPVCASDGLDDDGDPRRATQ